LEAITPWRTIVLVVAGAAALAGAGTASASFTAFPDRDDKPGPLDIKQATQGHGRGGRLVHTITTFGRWRNALLGPSTPNYFLIDISIDRDRKPERTVFIYSVKGRMVAVVLDSKGRSVAAARASRPSRKTVKVSFPRAGIERRPGYRWAAASFFEARGRCRGGCVDKLPNRGRILHDIAKPMIAFPVPDPMGSLMYAVDFTVTDTGDSGLAFSQLEHRDPPTLDWTPVWNSATGPPLPYLFSAGTSGDVDEFRVVAEDRHGNRAATGPVSVTAP
jgi:hypothetical protein